MKNTTYLFLLILAFAACKKDDVSTGDPISVNPQPKLTRIEQDAANYVIFGYNTDGLLNHFRQVNNNLTQEAHFGYNAGKKPVSGTAGPFEINFFYSAGLLDKVTYTSATPNNLQADHYLKFTYAGGRVSRVTDYFKSGANYIPGGKHVYTYYDNGDVKSDIFSYLTALPDHFDQVERNEYEYDAKVNPLQPADEILYALYLPKAAHNIIKMTTYDASDHLDETKRYSLNYNSFMMPITGVENTTYPNSPGINRNVKYLYQ